MPPIRKEKTQFRASPLITFGGHKCDFERQLKICRLEDFLKLHEVMSQELPSVDEVILHHSCRCDDIFVLSHPIVKLFRIQAVTEQDFYFEEMSIKKVYEVTEWDDTEVTVNIRAAHGKKVFFKVARTDDLYTILLEHDMRLHKMDQCSGEDVLLKHMS